MKTCNIIYYKMLIILLTFISVYALGHVQKLYLSAIFISAAFITTFFVYKKTFPFIIFAFGCYWFAIMQDLYGEYQYFDEWSRNLWTSGNILIAIGVSDLLFDWSKIIKEYLTKKQ